MLRSILIAAASVFFIGAGTLTAVDDASAQGQQGANRNSRGARAPSRVARPGGLRRPGRPTTQRPGTRPNHQRGASSGNTHRRGGSVAGGHRRFDSNAGGHRRFGSTGSHRRYGSVGPHQRFGSRGRVHRRSFSWGPAVVPYGGVPVRPAQPAQAVPAPACDECGQLLPDGCYTTYRKVTGPNGQPEMKCEKVCD